MRPRKLHYLCVTAHTTASDLGAVATTGVRLRNDVFDSRCEELGAFTESDKAAFVAVNQATLYRFRRQQLGPRLDVAMRFAERLGVKVEELWERVES